MRPHTLKPTTDILEVALAVGRRSVDLSASVQNEWLCMNRLAKFGLLVARTAIGTFGSQTLLDVERFYCQLHRSGPWIMH
jgi:serine/threonine-protein kinase HipA